MIKTTVKENVTGVQTFSIELKEFPIFLFIFVDRWNKVRLRLQWRSGRKRLFRSEMSLGSRLSWTIWSLSAQRLWVHWGLCREDEHPSESTAFRSNCIRCYNKAWKYSICCAELRILVFAKSSAFLIDLFIFMTPWPISVKPQRKLN